MVKFEKFTLPNGLTLIVHEDQSTPMIAVNILYKVGSKNESPDKTGFAHLFEHLMFGGSRNVPNFDLPLQLAGGENNAFTNADLTNFYDIVPSENIETALWIESDRMKDLIVSQEALDIQKKVVVEEFKETCLNQPYGDVWHNITNSAYTKHPYQWPTIGKIPKHISDAKLDDVQDFFNRHYAPNNAILVLAGHITAATALRLTQKWFGDIPPTKYCKKSIAEEPIQTEKKRILKEANVPVDALYLAFHMPGRNSKGYYLCDILSDALANGRSSRFYKHLYKEQKIFNQIDAYISGTIDPGLFIIEGKLSEHFTVEEGLDAIWKEIYKIQNEQFSNAELDKLKNKIISSLVFSEVNVLNRAMSLAFYEYLEDADMINDQIEQYINITSEDIQGMAKKVLVESNCTEVVYQKIVKTPLS